MSISIQPSFYAIIPATVRYCKTLEMGARMLYGEITALCTKEGFCWATNRYFAELYEVSLKTIERWIKSLKQEGFIFSEATNTNNGRILKLKESLPPTKMSGGYDKNVAHSNTSNNTGLLVCFKSKKSPGVVTMKRDEIHKKLQSEGFSEREVGDALTLALQQKEDNANLYVSNIVSYIRKIIQNTNKERENADRNKSRDRRSGKQGYFSRTVSKFTESSTHWEPEQGDEWGPGGNPYAV